MKYGVFYYVMKNNVSPAKNAIDKLPLEYRLKLFRCFVILQKHGKMLGTYSSSFVAEGLFETGIAYYQSSVVFYYFFDGNSIVITDVRYRMTKETRPVALKRSLDYKRDYVKRGDPKTIGFSTHFDECWKASSFRAEWQEAEGEYMTMDAVIGLRLETGMSRKNVSALGDISQGALTRMENGNTNASVQVLYRIGKAMGKKLRIVFE